MMAGGFESIKSSNRRAGAGIANNKLHALARLGVLAAVAYGVKHNILSSVVPESSGMVDYSYAVALR